MANTIVDRCSRTRPSSRSSTAGQIEGFCAVPAADPTTSSSVLPGGGPLVERGEVRHGDLDLDRERLRGARLDDLDRPGPGQERRHLVHRAHRRREPDPLRGALGDLLQALQRQREVRAALGARDRVDLVEDHRRDPAQRLAGGRGEQQEQRLRGGHQHVGRGPLELPPLVGGGVAGARADGDVGDRITEPLCGLPDAGERRPEVALHVDGERLQRRDVEDPAPAARLVRDGRRRQPVQRPEERREGLARPGRCDDEGVAPVLRGRPGALLGGGGRGERPLEPLAGGGGEAVECAHPTIMGSGTDNYPADRVPPAASAAGVGPGAGPDLLGVVGGELRDEPGDGPDHGRQEVRAQRVDVERGLPRVVRVDERGHGVAGAGREPAAHVLLDPAQGPLGAVLGAGEGGACGVVPVGEHQERQRPAGGVASSGSSLSTAVSCRTAKRAGSGPGAARVSRTAPSRTSETRR
ncbi:nitrate reductase molybdenum cofactor assembly chaperone [Pseudonocardia sp. Ae168_Ps1]|nr:nitrate reductase molybdenum cofactor assembly chaperone [Pseudonocardia sp. Ae150A_Ps1]OLL82772.1 nitrate reductase molybdenum cofactor assembly chaperone [Pseudonocardia sp. Ae168_Ps1]OLL83115.1 nitrate reductase molybdenum cofactor assembly chaperone [Pseudonocardia sp. Ae263_Ps1]OLL90847.1 nitrate reductase molybdenum cofactor assembly chaperone [Pseudonocardia sp. Ae356_Ps1]